MEHPNCHRITFCVNQLTEDAAYSEAYVNYLHDKLTKSYDREDFRQLLIHRARLRDIYSELRHIANKLESINVEAKVKAKDIFRNNR